VIRPIELRERIIRCDPMAEKPKPLMLTGVQPTGRLMIGNYIGAIKNWVELQASHEAFLFLADLHALTVPQDPTEMRRRVFEYVALFIACGVDSEKSTIFLQSHVPAHAQLLWVLNCLAPMGELQRMTQFKEKAGRQAAGTHAGLFDYPVLMAADILLYGADLVPVGDDQLQHLEFTRRLARKFNTAYGEVFRIPEVYTPRVGPRLMGLQTPSAKMSKSDKNPDNYVSLLDSPEAVRRKIGSAVTDSGSEVRCDADKPGITNLITLFAAVTGESAEAIQVRYVGKGYAEFKKDLAERLIAFLSPIQRRYLFIAADRAMIAEVLQRGARTARERSEATLSRVYGAVGLIPGNEGYHRISGVGPYFHGQQPDIPMPATPRALPNRRTTMETKETKDISTGLVAEADADEDCLTDCCVCCCCDTEEECSMEE
jgi:tryptophanyl-tRNA synthetase